MTSQILEPFHVNVENSTPAYSGISLVNHTSQASLHMEENIVPAKIFFTCVGSLITVATVLGNILVIVAVRTEKRLRKVGNTFIVNLAVSDLLVGCVVTPVSLVYHLQGTWQLGYIFCDIWISLDVICCTASIVNLCVISFDRYNAITQPLRYALKRTPKRAMIMISLVWLYSTSIALPPLFGWRENRPTRLIQCRVSQHFGYTIFSTAGAFYIPLCVMLVMYTKIFKATLKRKQKWLQPSLRRDGKCGNKAEFAVLINATDSMRRHYAQKEAVKQTTSSDCNTSLLTNPKSSRNEFFKHLRRSRSEDSSVDLDPSRRSSVSSLKMSPFTEINKRRSHRPPSRKRSSCSLSSTATTPNPSLSLDTTNSLADTSYDKNSPCDVAVPVGKTSNKVFLEVPRNAQIYTLKLINDSVSGDPSGCEPTAREVSAETSFSRCSNSSSPRPERQTKKKKRRKGRISVSQEKTAARTLGIIMGGFVVCWLPFFIVTLIGPLCDTCLPPPIIMEVFTWLGYFNSALNPIIYTFFNPDFRKAFRSILLCVTNR